METSWEAAGRRAILCVRVCFFRNVPVPLSWSGSGRRYRRWLVAWSWSVGLQRCGWSRPSAPDPSDRENDREREKSVSYNSPSVTTTTTPTTTLLCSRCLGATVQADSRPSQWCNGWMCCALCLGWQRSVWSGERPTAQERNLKRLNDHMQGWIKYRHRSIYSIYPMLTVCVYVHKQCWRRVATTETPVASNPSSGFWSWPGCSFVMSLR